MWFDSTSDLPNSIHQVWFDSTSNRPTSIHQVWFDSSSDRPTSIHQVWFQNRRAKWRRQEKMEASQLRLHHDYPLTPPLSGMTAPLDPWLASSMFAPSLLQTLPGFLAQPQTPYPSYLTPPSSLTPPLGRQPTAATGQARRTPSP